MTLDKDETFFTRAEWCVRYVRVLINYERVSKQTNTNHDLVYLS